MAMNIEAQKALIIEQFNQVNDINLINAIKSMLDYARKKDAAIYYIPEQHQKLVMQLFEKVRNNPDTLLDWDKAKKTLRS
ncbi:MAG: hypothetical protein KKA07_01125 [Bacteroidetes bacterium]|nr:hypothetical protein [Bacteroidota bacterium]